MSGIKLPNEGAPGPADGRRGESTVTALTRDVILVVSRGRQLARYADEFLAKINVELITSAELHVFHDAEEITTYEAEWRRRLEAWGRQNVRRCRSWHVLVVRPMPVMGANVSNLEYDGFMHIHHARATFDAALAQARAGR